MSAMSLFTSTPSPSNMQLSTSTDEMIPPQDPMEIYGGMCGTQQDSILSDVYWKSPEALHANPNSFPNHDNVTDMLGIVDADLFKQLSENMDFDSESFGLSPSFTTLNTERPLSSKVASPIKVHGQGKPAQECPRWTKHEDSLLTRIVNNVTIEYQDEAKKWLFVAEKVINRDAMQCAMRWKTTLDPQLIKEPWSKQEDQSLKSLVKKHGDKNWTLIARHIHGRLGRDCRERWATICPPNKPTRRLWTEEETNSLIEAHERLGHRWSEIAKVIPTRTESQIKNHWHSINRNRATRATSGGNQRKRKSGDISDGTPKRATSEQRRNTQRCSSSPTSSQPNRLKVASDLEMQQFPLVLRRTIAVLPRETTPVATTPETPNASQTQTQSLRPIPKKLPKGASTRPQTSNALLCTGLSTKLGKDVDKGLRQILKPANAQHNNTAPSYTSSFCSDERVGHAVAREMTPMSSRYSHNLNPPSSVPSLSTMRVEPAITPALTQKQTQLPRFTNSITSASIVLKPDPRKDIASPTSPKSSLRLRRGFGPIHVINPEAILLAAYTRVNERRKQDLENEQAVASHQSPPQHECNENIAPQKQHL